MNDDIQFLKDLQATMNHENQHDSDGQASPRFWSIMNYRTVPGHPDYDNGHTEYFFNDGDHVTFGNFEDLKEFLDEYFEDDLNVDEELQELLNNKDFSGLWEYVEENLNDDGYFNDVFVKEEEFIMPDTMFLTKEEAKRHLELNHYHYSSKAHTYAMTAWRAPKVERLMKILSEFDFDTLNNLGGTNNE